MNCKYCVHCIQISADEDEVLCDCPSFLTMKDYCFKPTWIDKPSYCKYFINEDIFNRIIIKEI